MIHHISIAAEDPERVARVIAELWQGVALPFPPVPGSYIAAAGDEHGTAIEVYPLGCEIEPGTDGQEFGSRRNGAASALTATHAALSVPVGETRVREIAAREGWRVERHDRGGAFEVLEFWIEGRLLLEVLTPEMARRYLDFMTPHNYAALFGFDLPRDDERQAA